MTFTNSILTAINNSVLCWLASVSEDGIPNVSPKELFVSYQEKYFIIANVASPNTVKNIKANAAVCVSFVDILVQKGYQLKGTAQIIEKDSSDFSIFLKMMPVSEKIYPIHHFIKIELKTAKEIVAPSYWLYPETTEEEMKTQAIKQYKL